MSTPPHPEKTSNENRWWELYFIRYFVGAVVGGAIILYLNVQAPLDNLIMPGVKDVAQLSAQQLSILAALGLAFCYIASAPILVLHATRAVFLAQNTKLHSWLVGGAAVLATILSVTYYCLQPIPNNRVAVAIFLLVTIMLVQVAQLSLSFLKKGEFVHTYYEKLTKARSRSGEGVRQYMESYKHLREHGNAFLILIFEVTLGIILASVPNPSYAFLVLLLWISPAAMIWVLGTVLEYRFAETP